MSEIRVGVAGLTHGHVWGLIDSWKHVEGARLVAVADATPLLVQAKERFERNYASWREMLDQEELDALVVTSDNVESAEITVAALAKGIPCLVEKAMAANVADAERMLAAWRASGKTLMINWPLAWQPWVYEVKRLIEADTIGSVFHVRFRNGHHGPKEIGCDEWFVGWLYDEVKNGGGAAGDFCCYGAAFARYLLGQPERIYGVRGNYTKDYAISDDHALFVARYPKASAVIEGTWATYGFDASANPVIHGKTGTIGVYGNEIRIFRAGQEPEILTPPPLTIATPAAYFAHLIATGEAPMGFLHPEIAADAVRIVAAGLESSRTGCEVAP